MRTDTAQPVRLSEYRAPDYLIDTVDLDIRLNLSATHVRARLSIRPNPKGRPLERDRQRSFEQTRPWEKEGMSRTTWYRRRKQRRGG